MGLSVFTRLPLRSSEIVKPGPTDPLTVDTALTEPAPITAVRATAVARATAMSGLRNVLNLIVSSLGRGWIRVS
jgi:hypothetical protein